VLLHLSVKDFVIVDRVEIEFEPGFTVLTGETGAGKSILIDALALVLGDRGDASVVRAGCERAEIAAQFDLSQLKPLHTWLTENDLAGDEGICLLRRVVDSGGRSRAFINGHAATLAQLREAGEWLVDIHGQHAHQSLLRAVSQRALLDGYGGLIDQARQVQDAYRVWQELKHQREAGERDAEALQHEREDLEWRVKELAVLQFTPDEWQALQTEHARLTHAASLIDGARYGVEVLSESENSLITQLAGLISKLNQLREYDAGLKETLDTLEPAEIQLQEAAHSLNHYVQRLDLDPERLNECEQRLSAIHATARKFRVTPEQLPDLLESANTRLAALIECADPAALARKEQEAKARYDESAKKLSAGRRQAGKKLSQKVSATLQQLAMAGGVFEVALTPVSEGAGYGHENVEFLVAAHAGMSPKPLAKVASGGELSRISLAIQVAAIDVAAVPTLIFDEVDVGIGGGVAEIVGALLKDVGLRHQVLCITHLPQVAAQGHHHLRVAKEPVKGATLSRIETLDKKARVEEVARMLGGVEITEKTRAHAAEMLARR
jgi:DNA repair protein RecN (Recombination protein N)